MSRNHKQTPPKCDGRQERKESLAQPITREECLRFYRDCQIGSDPVRQPEDWRRLEEKLLSIAGKSVIHQGAEPFAVRICERGQLYAQHVRMRRGLPCSCHSNAADLWVHDTDKRQLVTGYAFDGDLWRANSWVVEGDTLLETTIRSQRYFGVALSPIEAFKFFWENVVAEEFPDVRAIPADFWRDRPHLDPLFTAVATAIETYMPTPRRSKRKVGQRG